jgi:hypothetical protein
MKTNTFTGNGALWSENNKKARMLRNLSKNVTFKSRLISLNRI